MTVGNRWSSRSSAVIAHSSNEMYGADRVVLEVAQSLPPAVASRTTIWLPDDVKTNGNRLDAKLEELGLNWKSAPLPVVRRAYLRPRGLLALARRIWFTFFLLVDEKPRMVYCGTTAVLLLAPLARLAGVPRIVVHLQEVWSKREAPLLGFLARFCNELVAVSDAVLESIPASLRPRVTVIPNAVPEPQSWSPPKPTGALRFVMAGRWNAIKGHATLLRAWDTATPLGHLTILGGPPPSGVSVDVPAMVSGLLHPESVSVVGEVDDIGPYIDASDVMIVPTEGMEAFGLVAIEAFSRARPVIASSSGGLDSIIQHGRTGLKFVRGSSAQLRSCISQLDKKEVERMGKLARQEFESRYRTRRFRDDIAKLWLGSDLTSD